MSFDLLVRDAVLPDGTAANTGSSDERRVGKECRV